MRVSKYFGLSILLSMLITSGIREWFRHRPLDVELSTVGYPIFANFNIDGFFYLNYSKVFVFPLLACVFFELFVHFRSISLAQPKREKFESLKRVGGTSVSWIWLGLGLFVLSLSLISLSEVLPFIDRHYLKICIGFTGMMTLLIASLGVFLKGNFRHYLPMAGIIVNSMSFLALWSFSQRTYVVHQNKRLDYQWFSTELTVLCFVVCLMFMLFLLWKSRDQKAQLAIKLHYRSTVLVAMPVLVFLCRMYISGPVGLGDMFHFGESLGSAQLLLNGSLPYKETLFIHGFLADPFWSMLGFKIFENSLWGHTMGFTMIWVPLAWTTAYLLFAFMFLDSPLLVLTSLLVIIGPPHYYFTHIHTRFMFMPLVSMAFVAMIHYRNWIGCITFCTLAMLNFVIVPESAFALIAFAIIVIAFDFLVQRSIFYSLTVRCAFATAAVTGCIFYFFHSIGILEAFFEYFSVFAKNHRYTGGIPRDISWEFKHKLALDLTILFCCLSLWWTYFRVRVFKNARPVDWFFAAWAIFGVLYFQKFLSRADLHLYHSFTVALPLGFYLVYSVVGGVDHWLESRLSILKSPLALVLFVTSLGFCAVPVLGLVSTLPLKTRSDFSSVQRQAKLGFTLASKEQIAMIEDQKKFLRTYLGDKGRLFDFTNTPALFYYFLQLDSPTRFFHISMASGEYSQSLLIDELKKSNPEIIAFYGSLGLMSWDGISNMVRHYNVSEFLLRRYEPFVSLHGYFYLKRKDLDWKKPSELGLEFSGAKALESGFVDLVAPCDWEYVPNFFKSNSPVDEAVSAPLAMEQLSDTLFRFELPTGAQPKYLSFDGEMLSRGHYKIYRDRDFSAKPGRQVSFKSLNGAGKSLKIQVSSCFQWYLGRDRSFFVESPKVGAPPKIRIVN